MSQVIGTLAETFPAGASAQIINYGAGGFRISQLPGQSIRLNGLTSTPGTDGYLDVPGIDRDSRIDLICHTEDTVFIAHAIGTENAVVF